MTQAGPRRAIAADAPAIAVLHRLSLRTAMPWLAELHTPAEDLVFFAGVVATQTVWVIEGEGGLLGFAAVHEGWLNHLYVHPDRQTAGVGSVLLERVRADVDTLQLWAFQRNSRARAFYEAKGFEALELTDGSRNEEREPDVRYGWTRTI